MEELEFEERTLGIKRVTKTTKGGKRLRLFVCSAVGDLDSQVGVGFGKAQELANAIKKAQERAKKGMIKVKLRGDTIPHRVIGKCGGAKVLIRPASPGTGIIGCDVVRNILELGGVKDALSKSLGSNNWGNVAKATIDALSKLRTHKEVYKLRNIERA
jgi:small subunit ribosomal protein S5